ncbi:DUF2164 domain-containing protein [Heyndrickxia sporothermodurans]|uniref:DUF2164 domain-containing protein n=2 Tax=Heyndrickxia sporothermodurans TaxID=46224 RepID=A0A150LB51_9BACI|nr:DUF2164 domain-containing protein [Heyndrickxia sporothermodurans]KYD09557.1 hypothetical protein B4102_1955 [Heyndrickxia sporothermodurans]MBL5766743.1 DUF2164 domain-containing protein [Heyndrickxia sporothermodurans]MBL5770370.1 DUF2164 domain-containing protein [Heyndrickxia sporothermodurans]MBL5774024.1 DUF2164 domain-containing protein [Heyndrickxia sporothermodurans]MBL5777670.1 DUF2164 domain-containing protein [Heyndrickxia sporothermodurans]
MIKITKEMKEDAIREIQQFFLNERDEEIGDLAAENVFVFVKEKLGPIFYNEAIADAQKMVVQRMNSLEEELYTLEKRIK